MYERETAAEYEDRYFEQAGVHPRDRGHYADEVWTGKYGGQKSRCEACESEDGFCEVCHTNTGLRVLCEKCWKESQR